MSNNTIYNSLKETLDLYYNLSDETWNKFLKIIAIQYYKKNETVINLYDESKYFYFIYSGLFRAFTINEKGEEYTKMFFHQNRLFGAMASLIENTPIKTSVETLEDSIIIAINFKKFRELLFECEDLKLFYILYLEKHWIIEKKENEYSLILEDATTRYARFQKDFSHILDRIPQYHIASYLGITPTHLSRIRKKLKA